MAAQEDEVDINIDVEETPAETAEAESTEEKPEEIDAVCPPFCKQIMNMDFTFYRSLRR